MWFFFSFCKMNPMVSKSLLLEASCVRARGAVAPHRHDLARLFKVNPGVHISNMTGQSGHVGSTVSFFYKWILVNAVILVKAVYYIYISCFSTAAKNKSSQKNCWFVVRSMFEIFCSSASLQGSSETGVQRFAANEGFITVIVWYFLFIFAAFNFWSPKRWLPHLLSLWEPNLVLNLRSQNLSSLGLWSPGRPGLCGLFCFCSFVGFILWPRRVCAFASGAHVWQHRRQGWGASAQLFLGGGIQHEHHLSLQHVRGQEIDAFRQCEVDPDAEIAFSVFRASTFRKPSVFRWNSCAVWDKTLPRNASQPSFEEIFGMTCFDLQLHLCVLCMIAQVGGELFILLCWHGNIVNMARVDCWQLQVSLSCGV